MAASSIPSRVPLGFICGFPMGPGGEIYGGDMFLKSAAMDTLQGKAIQEANERWGDLSSFPSATPQSTATTRRSHHGQIVSKRKVSGRKGSNDVYIGIPVCKKKYTPFTVKGRKVIERSPSGKVSVHVTVERMYGCSCHSQARRQMILKHGERQGWEPFGQWSIAKAKTAAIKHVKLEMKKKGNSSTLGKPERVKYTENACANGLCDVEQSRTKYDSVCRNGECLWKSKDDYDDIDDEIRSSDSFDPKSETVVKCASPTTVVHQPSKNKKAKRRR